MQQKGIVDGGIFQSTLCLVWLEYSIICLAEAIPVQ